MFESDVVIENKLEPVSNIDPINPVFKPLHQLLGRLYHDAQGIGRTRKQAETIISIFEENKLLETP